MEFLLFMTETNFTGEAV